MSDDLINRKAALSAAWIGEGFASRRLSEFGDPGKEWGQRVQGKNKKSLGLKKGLFAHTTSREFALILCGAIAVHGKATVRHVPLALLADWLDSPFDYADELSQIENAGIACITDFFLHESEKIEVFPARTRFRVQSFLQRRLDSRRGIILHSDPLKPCSPWWQASFVEAVLARFEMIDL